MMRYAQSLVFVVVTGLAVSASAQTLSIGADGGVSTFTQENGPTGVGVNAYLGLHLPLGLSPEFNTGVQYGSKSLGSGVDMSLMVVPLYVGTRYSLKLPFGLEPFVGAHLGVAVMRAKVSLESSEANLNMSAAETHARFGFNAGGGLNYVVNDSFSVGAAVWYGQVVKPLSTGPDWKSVTTGVSVTYNLL